MELDEFSTALGQANGNAARAMFALVQGLGLHELLIEVMREQEDDRHVPGLRSWIETLKRTSARACEAADRVLVAVENEQYAESTELLSATSEATYECETALRSIAQLAMGTTTAYSETSAVARIERISSIIIGIDAGLGAGIFADGYQSAATDLAELEIELSGFLCRMNLEYGAQLEITVPKGTIVVRTDSLGEISASVELAATTKIALEELGWSPDASASWPSPPRIVQPVRQVANTLIALNDGSIEQIQYLVTFNESDE